MDILFYSARAYDKDSFVAANEKHQHALHFVSERLSVETAGRVQGERAICVFVNDILDKPVLSVLAEKGVELLALRSAGYNNVDVAAAHALAMRVVYVPAYSPHAVAEHALCLMLALNRKLHRAYCRVREGDFSLDGLLGFDFFGRTLGVVGTGRIGLEVARITRAMGMKVLAYDVVENRECVELGVEYVHFERLLADSDVISLHCPLTDATRYMINADTLRQMKPGVMLINTGRGGLVDTCAVIDGLKSGKIGYLGIDVYEGEGALFFTDRSCDIIQDDIFARLLSFPNVVVTAHQGFFTADALKTIAETTLESITQFEHGQMLKHAVPASG